MQVKYELSQEEAQQVINALAERPLKEVFNLFMKLNMQLTAQINPQPPVDEKGTNDKSAVTGQKTQ